MNDGIITSGVYTDFDPEQVPEGVTIHEHCHERSTILVRIGDRCWVGVGTFDDICRANNGMVRNHELAPGQIALRVALRRALNQMLGRVEADIDPEGMTWGDACSILGEIRREGSEDEGRCAMLFVVPVPPDGKVMRFHGYGRNADEAGSELARNVHRWAIENVR